MAKILIVEDETPISDLIRISLTKAGYETECVYDGAEAYDRIRAGGYDLILLDVMLPEVSGFELLESLGPVGTPVIFLTAMGNVIEAGDLMVDRASREVQRNGESLHLTRKEYDLLLLFLENPDRALFRETIYERIWGDDSESGIRVVDLNVQRLRRKLGWEEKIRAVSRVGYRYVAGKEKET